MGTESSATSFLNVPQWPAHIPSLCLYLHCFTSCCGTLRQRHPETFPGCVLLDPLGPCKVSCISFQVSYLPPFTAWDKVEEVLWAIYLPLPLLREQPKAAWYYFCLLWQKELWLSTHCLFVAHGCLHLTSGPFIALEGQGKRGCAVPLTIFMTTAAALNFLVARDSS